MELVEAWLKNQDAHRFRQNQVGKSTVRIAYEKGGVKTLRFIERTELKGLRELVDFLGKLHEDRADGGAYGEVTAEVLYGEKEWAWVCTAETIVKLPLDKVAAG